MRMRHKPWARPELAAWERCIDQPAAFRGRWGEAFPGRLALPLRLELGCGKGGFLARVGLAEPAYNYLGVDIKDEVLAVAKRSVERLYAEAGRPVDNVAICWQDIERIGAILAPEDRVERVYINFCNPWPKARDKKHRLTHPRQLVKYRAFLAPGGEIFFKTDDEGLYRDSLRYLALAGFAVDWATEDLHGAEPAWNLRTEHEDMFAGQGLRIYACVARMCEAELDAEAMARWKDV